MKKILVTLYVSILFLFLTGCNKKINTDNQIKANQIVYKQKTLTYNTSDIDEVFFNDGIDLVINKENNVRSINITNNEVETYKNISVGDPLSKLQSSYEYEEEMGSNVFVVIDGENEIPAISEKSDDSIYINYTCENNKVMSITIYDSKYASTFM